MTNRILIDGIVVIYPHELNEDMNNLIIEKLNAKYIVCNKQYGCITNISKIHNEYKTYIERNTGNIRVHVKFMADRILPIIGKLLKCTVHMIFNHGIFAQIDQHIKILIPIASIKNGKFIQNTQNGSVFEIKQNKQIKAAESTDSETTASDSDSTASDSDSTASDSDSTDTRIIKNGDIIKIKITDVKYNKNRYNCIGELC
jgi:DNA-directed RNA polymerase subunit E'/Rpb7